MVSFVVRFVGWALPTRLFERDDQREPEIRRRILARTGHLVEVVSVMTPPFISGFALVLWNQSPTRGLATWSALVLGSAIACLLAVRQMNRQTLPATPPISLTITMAVSGCTWGSIPIVAMPDDPASQALTGMLVFAPLAANAVFSASVPRLFWPFHLGLVLTASIGYLQSTSPTGFDTVVVLVYTIPFGAVISAIKMRHDEQAMYFALEHEATVAELSVSNEQLAVEASRDSLTGLSNRTDFTTRLELAMSTSESRGAQVGLLFIDLDHFKVVNDSLGHAAGDDLLVEVANRIVQRLRPTDVLARLGGDEFTVLVPEIDGVDAVARIADRVLTAFDQPFDLHGRRHRMSASIGVACTGEQGLTAADLLRLADAALYQAKGEGRARTSVFDASLRARLDGRLDDEAELREAITNNEFAGWFQPIVDMSNGQVDAAEGLVRWIGPGGVREAASFIDLAAEVGLDFELSAGVLDDLRELQTQLRAIGADIDLGFNLPPAHLLELLNLFAGDADLSGITVEITETGVIADVDRVVEFLRDIQRRGASVWLDDFGQGQSSMSLLTKLPLDAVKIDRQFVTNVVDDQTSQAIVSAIADLGRNLGYRVIAEGIENVEQADKLRELGVTHGQGYLFARALPSSEFLSLAHHGIDYAAVLGLTERASWRRLTPAQRRLSP